MLMCSVNTLTTLHEENINTHRINVFIVMFQPGLRDDARSSTLRSAAQRRSSQSSSRTSHLAALPQHLSSNTQYLIVFSSELSRSNCKHTHVLLASFCSMDMCLVCVCVCVCVCVLVHVTTPNESLAVTRTSSNEIANEPPSPPRITFHDSATWSDVATHADPG